MMCRVASDARCFPPWIVHSHFWCVALAFTMDAEKISEFQTITGASHEQAIFYLESCNQDLETAIENFFADGDKGPGGAPPPAPAAAPPASGSQARPVPDVAPQKKSSKNPNKIKTLRDMMAKDESSDEDEDNKGNKTYAGGTSSGLAIQNPGQKAKVSVICCPC